MNRAGPLYSREYLTERVWEWTRIRDLRRARGDPGKAAEAEEKRAYFAWLLEGARARTP